MGATPRGLQVRYAVAVCALGLGGAFGCTDDAPARAQWLLYIDTNAPVAGQIAQSPNLSSDAAIDAVRIEVVGSELPPREFLAHAALDWPISFGIAIDSAQPTVLRVRGFRSFLSFPVTEKGVVVSQPLAGTAIDRVVRLDDAMLDGAEDGITAVRFVLDADCFGALPLFGSEPRTCVDGERIAVPIHEGVELLSDGAVPDTVAGQWAPGIAEPCSIPAAEGRVCIPGGFTRLGDSNADLLTKSVFLPALPHRPVLLRPFFMDETEVSVGRYRAVAALQTAEPPDLQSVDPLCTYRGPNDDMHDDLPLNCVSDATADAFCRQQGGYLPSEAQWEHAARGRGSGAAFPWGFDGPQCCTTSILRSPTPMVALGMCGFGIEPVGSHPGSPGCEPAGDRSRDGVLDLGGSVSEIARDAAVPYDDPCWESVGIPWNPVCLPDAQIERTTRGGNWGSGPAATLAAARSFYFARVAVGFRCVYEDPS